MIPSEDEFELLKKDFILKSLALIQRLENLELIDFEEPGVKGDIANAHLESATSYFNLIELIATVKIKIRQEIKDEYL